MSFKTLIAATLLTMGLTIPVITQAAEHPSLIMTQAGVERMRAQLGSVPLFDASVESVKADVDAEIELGIDTPIPKDYSGGYTHQRHKRNFQVAQKAGVLYQILQDEKYANYVRDMLLQYEAMYKDLPLHPQTRSYARGKLFWQCLNDSNWLVFMSQAYDSIYNYLSEDERNRLEVNLFKPFADHISVDSPQFFNRVHNHSTWGIAGVGMIGLVMGDDELVDRALHGLKDDGLEIGTKDNDGGFIKVEGQKTGFLANIDEPFSPDGYYTEGPYYQRYAMYPFLIFAVGLNNVKPELNVLKHKNGVLLKAVDALLALSDVDGEFFPLNDGQKGMSYYAPELVTAVDIAYHLGGDARLLSIAQKQGSVLLDDAGFSVASAVQEGKALAYKKASVNLSDGADGKQGGVAILRSEDEQLELVFKYASQGLSHGHYDKLSFSLNENGDEVLQDYGLARFVNIGQKGGGNYLKENATWAKQTIAHNTITQDETSHFQGKYEIGSQHHSDLHFYDATDANVQIVSAKEKNAYPGTELQRTMAIIKNSTFEKPFVIDVMKINSNKKHQYDLPFYFMGQVISVNFDYNSPTRPRPLGDENGYQHLYVEGSGKPSDDSTQFSWLGDNKFYTLTTVTDNSDRLLFTRIGANDPEFNLRRDAGFMIRRKGAKNSVFASVIESHGSYSPVSEFAANSNSSIANLMISHDDDEYTAVTIESKDGDKSLLILSNTSSSVASAHSLMVGGETYKWTGPYQYLEKLK
ncbi:MAG: heparinase II/III family protein [Gammaproteobacteria bacterium]